MPTRAWGRTFECFHGRGEIRVGSGGSMVASLKLEGIDGRTPPGVEPAA